MTKLIFGLLLCSKGLIIIFLVFQFQIFAAVRVFDFLTRNLFEANPKKKDRLTLSLQFLVDYLSEFIAEFI